MEHWKIILDGWGEGDTGDVVTKDGEVIGTWTADENDHCSFTPDGADEPIYHNVFLGLFCAWIAEWHQKQDTA